MPELTLRQLGDGTTTDSPSPVSVSGISSATQISTPDEADSVLNEIHTCARLSSGLVKCWGANHLR